jgi:hypothetical protein
MPNFAVSYFIICSSLLGLALAGCRHVPPVTSRPTTQAQLQNGLTAPVNNDLLKAIVDPPIGWKQDAPKITANHRHLTWLSPTGDTAYGVIYFDLPLPMGLNLAFAGFLREMKKTEGEANLISKETDDAGLRFVAEGGLYTIRCRMQVDGFHGWVVYAGTLRSRHINQPELQKAELARDQTQIDLP